eukprot:jgi/Botrbrau1/23291/Bobra.0102s0032.2
MVLPKPAKTLSREVLTMSDSVLEGWSCPGMGCASFNVEEAAKYREVVDALELEPPLDNINPGLEDDDIQIEPDNDRLAKNVYCPISGKQILDLKEPVVDQMGFVYEKVEILAWLRSQGRGPASVMAPVVGTTHFISEASLKRAHRVLRAQKNAQHARRPPASSVDDAVDVD